MPRTLLRLPATLISTMKLRAAQRLAENRKEGYMDDSIHRNLVFICRYMDNEGKLHKVVRNHRHPDIIIAAKTE